MPQSPCLAEVDRCTLCRLPGAELCRAVGSARPRLRHIEREKLIAEEGTPQKLFGILRSGYLRKEKMRDNGRRTLIGLVRPGELVGGLPGSPMYYSLETATEVELCALENPGAARLVSDSPRIRSFLLADATRQHTEMLDLIWRRGALTSRERIIEFLVSATTFMPVEPHPDGGVVVTIELSRRDWADLSNTTVESISRTMTWLADRRLVSREAPTRYWIHDPAALGQLAGVDPDEMRKDHWPTRRSRPACHASAGGDPDMRVRSQAPSVTAFKGVSRASSRERG